MSAEEIAWDVVKAALPALPGLGKMLIDALAGGHGDADTRAKVADLVKEKLPEKSETERALEDLDELDDPPTPIEVPHPKAGG